MRMFDLGFTKRPTILPSKKSTHRTPLWLIEAIEVFYGGVIQLDPCASSDQGHWFAEQNYPKKVNGLHCAWFGKVYANPPFGRVLDQWIRKAETERRFCEGIVMLHPAFTGRKIWQDVIWRVANAICFLRGRLIFQGSKTGAAFNSQLTYYGNDVRRFERYFSKHGRIWILGEGDRQ